MESSAGASLSGFSLPKQCVKGKRNWKHETFVNRVLLLSVLGSIVSTH